MFLLLLCPVSRDYGPVVSWTDFVSFVSAAAFLAIPVVIFVFLWKNFAANAAAPPSEAVGFGLDAPSPISLNTGLSGWAVALYILTGFVTFTLGFLAFQAVQAFS